MCIRDRNDILRLSIYFQNNDNCIGGGTPVSYTHLDVYKRQMRTPTKNSYSIRSNIEEAGNLLYAASKLVHPTPKDGEDYVQMCIRGRQKGWTRPVAGSLRYMLSLRWYSTVRCV